MDAARLQLKIFVTPDAHLPTEAFIPVFHAWVKHHTLPELLVDVANYAHVPQGPGVVLIGHGTDYFMDESEGRLGLLFNRKRQAPPASERLGDTFRRTFHAAALLEAEPALAGKLRFATGELLFRINDRLVAPQGVATLETLRPELTAFASKLYGDGAFTLTATGEARELFGVTIKAKGPAPSLATLLERAGGPPAASA
jgi:hypothetical protein